MQLFDVCRELDEQTAIVEPKKPATNNKKVLYLLYDLDIIRRIIVITGLWPVGLILTLQAAGAAPAVSPAAAAKDEQRITDLFKRNADKDGEIDAYKLRTMLDGEFQKGRREVARFHINAEMPPRQFLQLSFY